MTNALSNVKLFGYRVLIEPVEGKTGTIVMPQSAQTMHRIGRVVCVGDGRQPDGTVKKSLVSVGDIVYFQTNAMTAASNGYVVGNMAYLNLHQGDLIGRLDSTVVCATNFTPLGRWVMVKPFVRSEGSLIVLPASAERDPNFVYFKVAKLGDQVDLPVTVGQEVLLTVHRTNAMQISKDSLNLGELEEYGYIDRDFVLGAVDESPVA